MCDLVRMKVVGCVGPQLAKAWRGLVSGFVRLGRRKRRPYSLKCETTVLFKVLHRIPPKPHSELSGLCVKSNPGFKTPWLKSLHLVINDVEKIRCTMNFDTEPTEDARNSRRPDSKRICHAAAD